MVEGKKKKEGTKPGSRPPGTPAAQLPANPVVDKQTETYCSANATACAPEPCFTHDNGTGQQQWTNTTYADGTSTTGPTCVTEPTEGPDEPTMAQILHAFRQVPLPSSELDIQPPGGETLVNFDTIFSTNATPFLREVPILDWTVELDITPASFVWHYGDGSTHTTTTPGQPWRDGIEVDDANYHLHQYAHAPQSVDPRVDTTWTARYRVDGGAWRDVDGTVTITGTPATLTVQEAHALLVDEHG